MTSSDPDQNNRRENRRHASGNQPDPNAASDSAASGDSARAMPFMLGRYEVVAELGAGAMGTVYKGRDKVLDRDVAIKVPKLENADVRSQMLQRFYREARAVARLNHPSICPIYDVGEIDGKVFIAMGFVKGAVLDNVVGKGRFLRPREAARLIAKICLAMQHAHNHQVVHRDLKSGNIMIDSEGLPVLLDFGLAMLRDEKDSGITHQGQILGSPAYMSPEQVNGRGVDHRSDIFSLGVIFYEALTGRRPFRGTMTQVLVGILQGRCEAPVTLNDDIPQELSDLCLKMMATSLQKRFQSMEECHSAITQYLARSSSGTSSPVHRSPRRSLPHNKAVDPTLGRWADEPILGDTPETLHSSDSEYTASDVGDGDTMRRKRTVKKSAERASVAETQPATDPTVRSVLNRAAEIDWDAVKHQEQKKKVATPPPENTSTPNRRLHVWIAVASLTVLSLSILPFVLVKDRVRESSVKTLEEVGDVDPPMQQGETKTPSAEKSGAAEKKDVAPSKSSFSLDDLDTPP